jgi:hypothetical protein
MEVSPWESFGRSDQILLFAQLNLKADLRVL